MQFRALILVLAPALVLASCGPEARPASDAAVETSVLDSAGDAMLSCPTGTHACGARCLSDNDVNSCGTRCAACPTDPNGTAGCAAAACTLTCAANFTACGGACVDTRTSSAHCGQCGTACATGQICLTGACATAPTCSNDSMCPRGYYCGASGVCAVGCSPTSCSTNETCNTTTRVCDCAANSNRCGGRCVVNSATACGATCATCTADPNGTASCNNGICEMTCAVGFTRCGTACVRTATDANHCGVCGLVCSNNQTCVAGSCATPPSCNSSTPCAAGYYCTTAGTCAPGCTNPSDCGANQGCDENRCVCGLGFHRCAGACTANTAVTSCGTSCTPCPLDPNGTPTCNTGTCGITCATGFTLCQGRCVRTNVDNDNCGTCGNACTVTQMCSNSACIGAQVCSAGSPCPSGNYCNALGRCEVGCGMTTDCGTNESCTPSHMCECAGGYHRCNGICVSNSSLSTCGQSCSACPVPQLGSASCTGVACEILCPSGYHQCGNECVSNSTTDTCGARCEPCAGAANATATCVAGTCGTQCVSGSLQCGGACALCPNDWIREATSYSSGTPTCSANACVLQCMNTFPPATNGDVIACADGCCPATTAWIEREPFVGPSSNGLPGNDQFFGYISNDGLSAVTVSARGFQTPTPTAQHHFYRYFGGVWEAESGPSETDLRAGALFAYIAAYTGDAFVVVRNRTTGFDLALWRRAPGGAYSQVAVAESFATNLTSVSGTMDFERIFVGRYNNTGTVEELNRQATGFTRTTIATFNAAPVISSSSDGSRILIGQQEWNNNFRWLGARAYVRLAGSWIDETPSGGTSGDGGVSSGFGEGPARITQDGTRIYVLNGQISVWNRSGSTWTQESSTTSGTTYSQVNNTPSVSGDGRYVFSGDTQSGAGLMGIYEYRAGTQPRFQRSLAPVVGLSLGYSPAGASFSADGSRALVNSGGNRIAFIERR